MQKPEVLGRAALVAVLLDMAERVSKGDSFEGSIEYSYWDQENGAGQDEFSAMGCYRVGNLDGQGGMRIIGRTVPD